MLLPFLADPGALRLVLQRIRLTRLLLVARSGSWSAMEGRSDLQLQRGKTKSMRA